MTLVQLESLVAIDRHRSFVRAAEQVSVSQPALSMQIQQLEDELGAQLFDRSRKPLVPTELGALIIAQARQVLAHSRQLRELARGFRHEVSGALRLAIIPTVSPYLVPVLLPRFAELAPQVELQIRDELTEHIVQGLRHDTFDAGILVTPLGSTLPEVHQLITIPLYYERIYVYVSSLNALASRSELRPDDLRQAPMLMLREGNCFRTQTVNICGTTHAPFSFKYDGNSLDALKNLVDRMDAVTLLPELAVRSLRPAEQKRAKPFAEPQPLREVSLVVNRSFLKQALIARLIDVIKEEMNAHVPLYADPAQVVAPR